MDGAGTRGRRVRRDDVRAVVVDDSRFMRELIGEMLGGEGIDVVATAADGDAALDAVRTHRPDVVTMDHEMPGTNGTEAVERIMRECPTPVLMLSAYTEADADVTFEALDAGAVDFFAKPGGEVSMGVQRHKERLVETVRSVAAADISAAATQERSRTARATAASVSKSRSRSRGAAAESPSPSASPSPSRSPSAPAPPRTDDPLTVVVAASTGGPDAVERVVASLPGDADMRVIVVQHMPAAFTGRFADRLDAACELDVREATHGARIGAGEALVAPGGQHLAVSNYRAGRLRVSLTDDPVDGVKPAADVTMRTAADTVDDPLLGVVLTGMGADGVEGVEAIAAAGGHVIAQDEASSVIYGMPKRAYETGCVDEVLSLDDIAAGVAGRVA
jgi:two-component system chemotaxis response regulator CheB